MIKKLTWAFALILACCAILASCSDNDVISPDKPQPVDPVEPDKPVQPTFTTMKEALEQIKGVEKITEVKDTAYKECYKFFIRQPIDHQNSEIGEFMQQVIVKFVGFDAPTVLCTCGYSIDVNDEELAQLVNGNLILVEHRYFGESVVNNDPQWKYLTQKQVSDDLHAVVTALKTSLTGKWVSTGVSNNGSTAIHYRYFYPDDVNGTVTFGAPLLTSLNDPRPMSYMLKECGTPEVNATMNKMVEKLLTGGEKGFYQKIREYQGEDDAVTFTQYCYGVLNLYFNTFMNSTSSSWGSLLPDSNTPDNKLCEMIDDMVLLSPVDDDPEVMYYPYFIKQAKELGIESCIVDETRTLLEGTSCTLESEASMRLMPRDKWLVKTYDNSVVMKILKEFLPSTTCQMLLVYSKNDPWTGGRPEGLDNSHVKVLINPVGIHDECLLEDPETYDEATVTAVKAFVDGL